MQIFLIVLGIVVAAIGIVFGFGSRGGSPGGGKLFGVEVEGPAWLLLVIVGIAVVVFASARDWDIDDTSTTADSTTSTRTAAPSSTDDGASETTEPTTATSATTTTTPETTVTTPTTLPTSLEILVTSFNRSQWDETISYRRSNASSAVTSFGSTLEYSTRNIPPAEGAAGVDIWHIYQAQCWEPSEMGRLGSIDFQLDRRASAEGLSQLLSSFGVSQRFGILQDGGLTAVTVEKYESQGALFSFSNGSLQGVTVGGVAAEEFDTLFDFSAGGSQICFGFLNTTFTNEGGGVEYSYGIDNFKVTAEPASR